MITDCSVLRTLTILPTFAIHGAPSPLLAHVWGAVKVESPLASELDVWIDF